MRFAGVPGGVNGVSGKGSACPLDTRLAVAMRAASRFRLATAHHGSGAAPEVELEPPEDCEPEAPAEDGLLPEEPLWELPELPNPVMAYSAGTTGAAAGAGLFSAVGRGLPAAETCRGLLPAAAIGAAPDAAAGALDGAGGLARAMVWTMP